MGEAEETNEAPSEAPAEPQPITFAEFLEGVSPSQMVKISDLWTRRYIGVGFNDELQTPQLQLHCTSDTCNGLRFFRYAAGNKEFKGAISLQTYLRYRCSNCQTTWKTYSLYAIRQATEPMGQCYKFGELPPYGPPLLIV